MGVVAFDPSSFSDALLEIIGDDANMADVIEEMPELFAISPAAFYVLVLQSFQTEDHVFVHVDNPNRVIIANEDVDEWLDYLAMLVADSLGVIMPKEIEDEYDVFNRLGSSGYEPENILKKILTNALETDIIVLTGGKKEIAAGFLLVP